MAPPVPTSDGPHDEALRVSSVAAIVLCGGTSRRFGGVDKTQQLVGEHTVLDTLLDALPAEWPLTCVGVPRPTTRPVTWTREDPPLGGPVAGIAAGLAASPQTAYVVVLAGDQPHAGPAALAVAQALASSDAEPVVERGEATEPTTRTGTSGRTGTTAPTGATAPTSSPHGPGSASRVDAVAARGGDGRPALLLAAYRRGSLLAALRGDVRDLGVYRTLAGLHVETVDVPAAQGLDVDTPADLARAARHDAGGDPRG